MNFGAFDPKMMTPVRLQQMQLMMNQQLQSPNMSNNLLRQQQMSQMYFSQMQQQQALNQRMMGQPVAFLGQNMPQFQVMPNGFPSVQMSPNTMMKTMADVLPADESAPLEPKQELSDKENNVEPFVVT
jgi:glucose dehydrogenase